MHRTLAGRPLLAAAGLFVAFALVGVAFVRQKDLLDRASQREAAGNAAAAAAFTLEQQLSRSLSATYALASVIRQHGRIDDFEALAAEMLPIYGGLSCLQLAPGAVISRIHPLRGHEAAMGHDLLRDRDRRFQAQAAVDSRQLTLAGPFALRQGGLGLVGRLAVFLPDPAAPARERLWGLVVAVIRVPDLLHAAQVRRLEDAGYAWELTRIDPETEAKERFAGSERAVPVDPVMLPVAVPNGLWTLYVARAGGWGGSTWIQALYGLALFVAALLTAFGLVLMRQPQILQRLVAERTAELARANECLAEDNARRRRAEEALAVTQEVVDRAVVAIAWIDDADRVVYANETFAVLCGRGRGEIEGRPLREGFAALAEDEWYAARRGLSRAPSMTREVDLRTGTETTRAVLSLAALELDGSELVVLFVTDVTAARRAEAQLRHAQKMEAIGELAGGIAHDFNNILTGILAHAGHLHDEAATGSDVRETALTITDAARRAADLTRQLLGFARRGKHLSAPFDVHALVLEISRLLSRTLDKHIRVRLRLEAPRSVVVGDPGQIQQAVLNLAVNARDAMPDGGELGVTTSVREIAADDRSRLPGLKPGSHLALEVEDSGHGIPRELRGRIFEPFFTTKQGRGTGMGLAMVYGIVRNHGGAVEVESEPGKGARFTLYLPLAAEALAAAEAPRPDRGSPRGEGLVLVVDDDDLPRGAATRLLRDAGFEVVGAASGDEALRLYRSRPGIAAVLLDLAMPEMDGRSCFRALRRLDPAVRVVFTSGHERDGGVQELLEAGGLDFVPKPFTSRELVGAVARAARRP